MHESSVSECAKPRLQKGLHPAIRGALSPAVKHSVLPSTDGVHPVEFQHVVSGRLCHGFCQAGRASRCSGRANNDKQLVSYAPTPRMCLLQGQMVAFPPSSPQLCKACALVSYGWCFRDQYIQQAEQVRIPPSACLSTYTGNQASTLKSVQLSFFSRSSSIHPSTPPSMHA